MDHQMHDSVGAVRQPGSLSRRRFLQMVGATAGSAAVLNILTAWGQQPIEGQAGPPVMDGTGNGTKVVVIGAGPGGSVAAYELMKLGYDVTVLEARDRVGGHVFTIKNGVKTEEYGKGEQICDWPEGMWWDAGPSRIPHYHRGFFHYTREFNVPLIDHNNINLNGWVYNENIDGNLNGKRMRLGTLQADMAGYTSQYLATAMDQVALDQDLTPEDAEYIKSYLINWGLLDSSDLTARVTDHRGYTHFPDAFSAGEIANPYAMADLAPFAAAALRASGGYIASTSSFDWQQTMVKPKGGIGELYDVGFRNALGDRVKLNCEVTEIRQDEDGVRIVYVNKETGETAEVTGDYAMCNMPLPVLIKTKADFSKEFTEAIRSVPYAMAHRLAGAFKRRFWEEDDWIYGGQSFSNNPQVGVIDYPDDDYNMGEGGAMMMAYNFGNMAGEISRLSYEDRIELALKNASAVHPQIRDDFISGFSVAWHLEPYSLGAWPSFNSHTRATVMPRLQQPEGRVYLVGEHLSNVNAWIEGATQAAWMQVEQLHKRVMQG